MFKVDEPMNIHRLPEYKQLDQDILDLNGQKVEQQVVKVHESDETDEEFNWYNSEKHDQESYFCFINLQRKTLQPGE